MLEVILILLILLIWIAWALPWILRYLTGRYTKPTHTSKRASDLHCLVELAGDDEQGDKADAFELKIRGLISATSQWCEVDVQILIADVSDKRTEAMPVLSTVKQLQMEDSPAFCFQSHIGNLPGRETILSNWTKIAQIRTDLLKFPRKGRRKLKFITSIICAADNSELACSVAIIDYQNSQAGYIDAKENQQRSETLIVQLAAALCSCPGQLNEPAVGVVTDWISNRIKTLSSKDEKAPKRRELEQSLQDALKSQKTHNRPDIDALCREIAETATIIERYDATELSLRAARAGGSISPLQIDVLSRLANLIGVDPEKFRAMVQKILPLEIYESKDVEFILGITADMSTEDVRRLLNREYRKWNARVNHPNHATRSQANQMLALIAEARAKYVRKTCRV